MDTIILQSNSKNDLKLIAEIAKKMGVTVVKKNSSSSIMDEIEQGLKEVKLMKEGKLQKKPLNDLINGK
ncbi:hypothetical protein [Natronoflexus pectinivorans]|uniref:Uncharacterized protein n=1 Tax=Natronoflexus pectinivorans TaxID=682526 RepID=A0A4R2GPF7_9BACT|nr:hypothetical protein [Natronoflexus pectinivorans]TCO11020.1 hypothetical protein EV194_101654 [Natronoflexus pectinivorans]